MGQYLNESGDVYAIRNNFLGVIARGRAQAMCKMKLWADLKNAVVREAFRKIGQTAPYEALEEFGLCRPQCLLRSLRELFRSWREGRMTEKLYDARAHALNADIEMWRGRGQVSDADYDAFQKEYMTQTECVHKNKPQCRNMG